MVFDLVLIIVGIFLFVIDYRNYRSLCRLHEKLDNGDITSEQALKELKGLED